jgi:short-subunit dehydrogenase
MAASLSFQSALVTGASSGIGESVARRLASAGVPTVVVARRRERLEALAEELPGIEVLVGDLRRPESRRDIEARLADDDRPIDLLVNNAGFGTSGPVASIDSRRLADEVRLNVLALTLLTRAALPGMLARGRGWILNVSSVAGFQPAPNLATYAATKAYVTSFTEALHEELRGTGVRATALCPGLTRTEFQSISNTTGFVDRYPARVWLTADEVAAAGLDAVRRGRALCVPGLPYKAMAAVSSVLPHTVVRRVARLASPR